VTGEPVHMRVSAVYDVSRLPQVKSC
jgi:hypothetical protein